MKTNVVCVKCEIGYKIKKNGAYLIEMFCEPPQPYKIWMCDIWKCPKCNREVVKGFGSTPIAEHFQANFNRILAGVLESKDSVVIYEYEK